MYGIGFSEIIMILIFLFPLPPLITGLLARKKGRRFWAWIGIGFLICVSSNIVSGMLKAKIAPETFPEFQLIAGAIAGPLVALFLKSVPRKQPEDEEGDGDRGRR